MVAQARGRRLLAWHADTCPACGRMPKEKRRIHEHGTDRHSATCTIEIASGAARADLRVH